MKHKTTIAGALFGLFAIVFGAFGAHALKLYLTPEQLSAFETGIKYQMYHAIFLLFIGQSTLAENTKNRLFILTLCGVFLFSGSIYLLTTKNISGLDFKCIGFLTPIGGLFLIAAWMVLISDLLKKEK